MNSPSHQPPRSETPIANISAASVSLRVTGCDPKIVNAVQSTLQDPLLNRAIAVAFDPATTNIEVTAVRGRKPSCVQRGTKITFEHTANARQVIQEFKQEIFRNAARALLLATTQSYVRTGEISDNQTADLKSFLGGALGVALDSESNLKKAVVLFTKQDAQAFEEHKTAVLKKIDKHSPRPLLNNQEAMRAIEHLGDLTCTALALSLLTDSNQARSKTIDRLSTAVANLTKATEGLWHRHLFLGDRATIEETIELFNLIKTTFRAPGFNDTNTRIFPQEEPRAPVPARLFEESPPMRNSPRRPFSPPTLLDIPVRVLEKRAALELDRELRAYQTTDDDVLGLLSNEIFDLLPEVPQAIDALEREKPLHIPAALSKFIEAICLLRFHGGTNGLIRFGEVACDLIPDERDDLLKNPDRCVAAHPRNYCILVEFLATWNLKMSTCTRVILLDEMLDRLRNIAALMIFTYSSSRESAFYTATLIQGKHLSSTEASALRVDAQKLDHAGKNQRNSFVRAYVTRSSRAIRRLLLTQVIADMPLERRMRHVERLNTMLTQQRTEATERPQDPGDLSKLWKLQDQFISTVLKNIEQNHARVASELANFWEHLESSLSSAYETDVSKFNRLLQQAVRLTPFIKDRDIATKAISVLSDFSIQLTNLINQGALFQLEEGATLFAKEPNGFRASEMLLERAVEHLAELQSLRKTFLETSFADSAIRVNHIDRVIHAIRTAVASTLLADTEKFAQYLKEAGALLRTKRAPKATPVLAKEAALLPIILGRLRNGPWKEDYRALQREFGLYN